LTDEEVFALFHETDADRDGYVTIQELKDKLKSAKDLLESEKMTR